MLIEEDVTRKTSQTKDKLKGIEECKKFHFSKKKFSETKNLFKFFNDSLVNKLLA